MSCPYFYPVERHVSTGGSPATVLPLGDLWSGECRAAGGAGAPAELRHRTLCNLGYARGQCPRFPPAPELPDAVRFAVASDHDALIQLRYVIERDHHPFAHGRLEFSCDRAAFSLPPDGENLGRQARAYLDSYLHRKSAAAAR